MSKLLDMMMRGYTPVYAPHNNRKSTRGRNYKYVKDSNGKTRKVWPDLDKS